MANQFSYIDIHGHVNFPDYDADREEVIARAHEAEVAMINVGVDLESSKSALELARKNEGMFATVGLHPIDSPEEVADVKSYVELARDSKVVAIGECGLDYFRLASESIAKQRQTFEAMIDVANEVKKPLMLHIRNGKDKSAYKEAFGIVKERAKVKGNLHFFAGTIEEAKPFLDVGFSFSFTGVITFTRDYDEVIKYIPVDKIMTETDCPFVAPKPHRGMRNEPSYVVEVVKALAMIKNQPENVIKEQVFANARNFFMVF